MQELWIQEQLWLKQQLITSDDVEFHLPGWQDPDKPSASSPLRLIGGVDISFFPEDDHPAGLGQQQLSSRTGAQEAQIPPESQRAVAALVVLNYPVGARSVWCLDWYGRGERGEDLEVVYEDYEELDLQVPYISGFLAFREVPAFQVLLDRAASTPCMPQVVLVDGCGILHHQGFGSACHLGVITGCPTIGVAKKLLEVEGLEPGAVRQALDQGQATTGPVAGGGTAAEATGAAPVTTAPVVPGAAGSADTIGSCVKLVGSSGAVLGAALRPGRLKNPIYVSVGHRVGLETAVEVVRSCCRFRVPEPTRQADIKSREFIRNLMQTTKTVDKKD